MSAAVRVLALVAFASVAASVARALAAGQDLGFDFTTYHYYLGYSAAIDRLALDFLPAGFQGYQSPLPYAALYLLDAAGVPPAANAALHAGFHALNLVALFLLTRLTLQADGSQAPRYALAACWLLGACAPIYWRMVGASSPDLVTGALVLGGLWLVARSLPAPKGAALRALALGAALVGAAAGMRWHNAIYLVALVCALAPLRVPRALGVASASAAAGCLVAFAPWAWRLLREFGSPVFPFFNGVFRSPDFPAASLPLTNFVPQSLAELVMLPLRIGTHADWVYVEARLPDVRPALLALAVCVCGVAWAVRRAAARPAPPQASPQAAFIVGFFLVAAALWLATSANGRYGVVLFLLLGPVCGFVLLRALPARYVLLAIAAVVVWQAMLHQTFFRQMRAPSGPWTARHFDWQLPEPAAQAPALFLGFGYKSASSVAPRTHPRSRHVNLVGQHTPGPDQPDAARIERLIDAAPGRIYGLFDFYYTQQPDTASRSIKNYFAGHLGLWGLGFVEHPCQLVPLKPPPAQWGWLNHVAGAAQRGAPPEYILCELRRGPPAARESALREYRALRERLAPLAAACPQYFGKHLTLVRVANAWQMTSFATLEARLDLADHGEVLLLQTRPPFAELSVGLSTREAIVPRGQDCAAWFSALRQMSAQSARR